VALLDKEGIERAGIINYVAPVVMGFTEEVNPWAANYTRDFRDRFIPFGGIDPTTVKDAAATMDRILHEWKLPALKLHPPHQLFYPNQYRTGLKSLETIYRLAEQVRLPVMIHTGTSIFPGARNVYADPIYVDDVGVDFPDLPVILATAGGRCGPIGGVCGAAPPQLLDGHLRHPAAEPAQVFPAARAAGRQGIVGLGLARARRARHGLESGEVHGAAPKC
jgi:predicted TIM-barrel fold metal-dependent hydrolase